MNPIRLLLEFFAKGESYHFTCPSNGMSSSSSVQNSIITVGTELGDVIKV